MTIQVVKRTVLVIGPAIQYRNYIDSVTETVLAARRELIITGAFGSIVINGVLYLQTLSTSQIHGRSVHDTSYVYVGNVGTQTDTILWMCADAKFPREPDIE